jgi:hypothetical protein
MLAKSICFVVIVSAMTFFLTPCDALAAEYYVQQSVGNDANPGDDWGVGHAFKSITRALQVVASNPGATGDTIHVAAATYSEQLQIVSGMKDLILLGGYPKNGGDDPDPDINITAIDGSNSWRPLTIDQAINVRVEGFEIRNGKLVGIGGGVFINQSSNVELTRNSVHDNEATNEWGGGIAAQYSTVKLSNNRIWKNRTNQEGGGVSLHNVTSGSLSGNRIEQNHAGGSGGGIKCESSAIEINNNIISANDSSVEGGGIDVSNSNGVNILDNTITTNLTAHDGAGILYHNSQNCMISKNLIHGNVTGDWGGGLSIRTDADLREFTNNIVAENHAGNGGAAVDIHAGSTFEFTNNTFAGNIAHAPTPKNELCNGITLNMNSTATAKNCILWDMSSQSGAKEICLLDTGTNVFNATYSDVWGQWAGIGNINAPPLFDQGRHERESDAYYLEKKSPCINVGTSMGAPAQDFQGTPRPIGPEVDMGAFEYSSVPDLTGEWKSLTWRLNILAGKFVVENLIIHRSARDFDVAFYPSRDGQTLGPVPLKVVHVKRVEEDKNIGFKYRTGSVRPNYVIAVIDWKDQVVEVREDNNKIAKSVDVP